MKKGLLCVLLLWMGVHSYAQNCWKKQLNISAFSSGANAAATIGNKHFLLNEQLLTCVSNTGNVVWAKNLQLTEVKALLPATNGMLFVAGDRTVRQDSLPLGIGTYITQAVIIKIDTQGTTIWERLLPPSGYPLSSIATAAATSAGGLLVGLVQSGTQGSAYTYDLVELNNLGNIAASKRIPQGYGNYTLASAATGYYVFSNQELIALNSQLDTLWVVSRADLGLSSISKVVATSPSGGIASGNNLVRFDSNGNVVWTNNGAATTIVEAPGGYLSAKIMRDTSVHPYFYIQLQKITSQGSNSWFLDVKKPTGNQTLGYLNVSGKDIFMADANLSYLVMTDSSGACLAQTIDTILPVVPTRLAVNQLSAFLANDGIVFRDPDVLLNNFSGVAYGTPSTSSKNTIFTSALWLGGIDGGGNLHMAAQTYRQSGVDYMPWPIAAPTNERANWDHIWKVTRQEVVTVMQDFADNGQLDNAIPEAVKHWPAKFNANAKGALGAPISVLFDAAPFNDRNGDGIYNVYDGDYPVVYGDEMYWWMFTDSLPILHGETLGKPLGVDVAAMAYAFYAPQDSVLQRTIFTRYEITNKSVNNYTNMFVGVFTDFDLGCFNNDYIGCDTVGHFYYAYNGTAQDTCAPRQGAAFGNEQVVQSVVFLSHTLDRFGWAFNTSFGSAAQNYYQSLQTLDVNGLHPVNPVTGNIALHYFPSDPADATGWSEVSVNNIASDRSALGSAGPLTLPVGQKVTFEVAYVAHTNGNLVSGDSFSGIQAEVDDLRQFHNGYFPLPVTEALAIDWQLAVYPNPNTGSFAIQVAAPATIQVFDLAGKLMPVTVQNLPDAVLVSGLAVGTYIVKVGKQGQYKHQKVMVF